MNYILFDDPIIWANLQPFTLTKPISELRIGILTIKEKWEKYLHQNSSYFTETYLQNKFQLVLDRDNICIHTAYLPTEELVQEIKNLKANQMLTDNDNNWIAFRGLSKENSLVMPQNSADKIKIKSKATTKKIKNIWDIFSLNGQEIQSDFQLICKNRTSNQIADQHTIVYKPENVFIEEGAKLKACILNAEKGYIYVGKNAEIQEGCMIQGNVAFCEGAVINMGAKIRNDTTIGPYCKVGGEISNSVFFGYSNKAHDGFLGNSVIGEWCNLGADTNTSNLKNNYSNVKIWNYPKNSYVDTGRQFCGLMMGDHSKAGINTMFNTGTVTGVCANIFGGDFPPKFIPSFSWGGAKGFEKYDIEKAFETAKKVMERRQIDFTETDKVILREIFSK